MASISFNGLGSGLQVSEIVTALVSAESTPFNARMNSRESAITTDISAAGALKSALESVQNSLAGLAKLDNYQLRKASGNDDFLSISADKEASIGDYQIAVDQLAAKHKLSSNAFASDEKLGAGTLSLSVGDTSFDVEVGADATLEDIKNAINDHEGNKGLTATIINGDDGQHLVLTANDTGADNQITVTANDADGTHTDASGLSRLAYDANAATPVLNMNEIRAAQDAKITIDGTLSVSSSSNEFSDAIAGTTITVKKAHGADDDLSNVEIAENNNNISAGLTSFVNAYNEFLDLANQLGKAGEKGAGPMAGDSLLRGVMTKLRQQITQPIDLGDGKTLSLSELGVETDRYGKLSLNTDTLKDKIAEDVDLVQRFLVGEGGEESGLVFSLTSVLDSYTDSDGLIQSRLDSKEQQLTRLDDERIAFSRKMASLEKRLYAQYNAMDLLVAQMNSTSEYVQNQLDNLPGVAKKSD